MPPSEVKAINCLRLMVEGKGAKDDRGSKLGGSGNCIYNIHLKQSAYIEVRSHACDSF